MQLFSCTNCGQVLYFENIRCEHCGSAVGMAASRQGVAAVSAWDTEREASGNVGVEGGVMPFNEGFNDDYRYCANHEFGVCNWLVPAGGDAFCMACQLNRTIPDLQQIRYREYWTSLEAAKHRLVYSIIRLRLPLINKVKDRARGLSFDFVADERDKKVFTGHDNGLITINIAEADDIQREMTRLNMHEPYRTVLGHFRHEVGHYYWDILIRDAGRLEGFRGIFGDDSVSYGDALQRYYQEGPATNWNNNYISAYASSHPWEDWAETWAHYMHIMDTLETAFAYDLRIRPRLIRYEEMAGAMVFDPYTEWQFDRIISNWLPLTFAMNSLNSSMGVGNIYPFIIVPAVMKKLSYIHELCQETAARERSSASGGLAGVV